tara:strand:+ start:2646 stop:2996 length:351 start_codon:yes stop_codon:yes gene_type:complete
MDLSNCICYNKRKKDKSVKDYKKDKSMKDYENKMKVISSPQILPDGNLVKIYCSNIICNVYDITPLKKQAVYREKVHFFCSHECWQDWLINPYIYNNLTPPTQFKDISNSIPEFKL